MMRKNDIILKLPIFMLGFTSMLTQLVIIREFLGFFNGNELIIGVIFCLWMLLTAIGAVLGGFIKPHKRQNLTLFISLIIFSLLPLCSILLYRFIRINYFGTGISANLNEIILVTSFVLLLFCLCSGFLFTLLNSYFGKHYHKNNISQVYFIETIGSIIGALIFSSIFVYFFKSIYLLKLLTVANFLLIIIFSYSFKEWYFKTISIFFLFLSISLFFIDLDAYTKTKIYQGQTIVEDIESPYGNILVTQWHEQYNFYENAYLSYATGDVIAQEEKIHYIMSQHPDPKNILLIHGGMSGTINELLKYPNIQIDYLENNRHIIRIVKEYNISTFEQTNNIIEDPIRYLKRTSKNYDIIIADIPEPTNAQTNRLFTRSFFALIKNKLNKDGIFQTALSPSGAYLTKHALDLHSTIYNTLKSSFNNILIIPGNKHYFLASDAPIEGNIAAYFSQSKINNQYVNQYYLDDELIHQKSIQIHNQLIKNKAINSDIRPIAYYEHINYWLSLNSANYTVIYIIIFCIILLFIFQFSSVSLCLFTGGMAGGSMQLIFIISFQMVYGYIYSFIGVIISLFMIGLALGAYISSKDYIKSHIKTLLHIQLFFALFIFISTFVLFIIFSYPLYNPLSYIFFVILSCILGFFVGVEFSIATKLLPKRVGLIASQLYSVDMLGGALGALITATFMLPAYGIINTCIFMGVFNLISAFVLFLNKKAYN